MRTKTLTGAIAVAALATALAAPPALATESTPAPGAVGTREFRNSCDPKKAVLPAEVEGDPTVKPGAVDPANALALYVWHDPKGWRVRLTHNLAKSAEGKPQLVEVRGRITSSRPIGNVRLVRLEDKQRGEWVSVKRPGRRVVDFRFVNGGYIDGIDFTAGCAGRLTFTVWSVSRDADGKLVMENGTVKRTPLPVLVGAARTPVTASVPANPGLVSPPADATKVRILRTRVVPTPTA